jgi:hypothetical protein
MIKIVQKQNFTKEVRGMKKLIFLLLVCALVLSSAITLSRTIQSKTRSSNSNENIVRKPIDLYVIIPFESKNKYSSLLEALKVRYNTKVMYEKDISSLPSPKVGMCFITFGDKNLLREQLKKMNVKFNVEEIPVGKDEQMKIRQEAEKDILTISPGIKLDWGDSEQYASVLYGVKILPNGVTDEIEGQSNLGRPDLDSITNWIEGTYNNSSSPRTNFQSNGN